MDSILAESWKNPTSTKSRVAICKAIVLLKRLTKVQKSYENKFPFASSDDQEIFEQFAPQRQTCDTFRI